MFENKTVTIKTQVCHSTEEFVSLKDAVERAGGRIRNTWVNRSGYGITCEIVFEDRSS